MSRCSFVIVLVISFRDVTWPPTSPLSSGVTEPSGNHLSTRSPFRAHSGSMEIAGKRSYRIRSNALTAGTQMAYVHQANTVRICRSCPKFSFFPCDVDSFIRCLARFFPLDSLMNPLSHSMSQTFWICGRRWSLALHVTRVWGPYLRALTQRRPFSQTFLILMRSPEICRVHDKIGLRLRLKPKHETQL